MLRSLRWLMLAVLVVVPGRVVFGETVAGLPAPAGYVNDFAGVLSAETRQSLEELCTEVDQKAHAQIAVVTVKTLDADKSGAVPTVEEFATALEDKWKVGAKGTDRGVLLIFISSTGHGRIEVGYGLEGLLNDAKVGDIGREMRPLLEGGDYNQGVTLGVHEVAQDIAADAGVTLAQPANGGVPAMQYKWQPQTQMSNTSVLLLGGLIIVVVGVLIRTGHIGWLFFFLFNMLGGGRGGGGDGGGGFGGGGGGNDGGGFGGFGGGSSGGGGADF
ncbi:MAG TPA: TPM domain-containing protein [Acidobacteriaceae bacterium]|nr:TPM domain-containing protein [Acidobacteriaceae bacterium]